MAGGQKRLKDSDAAAVSRFICPAPIILLTFCSASPGGKKDICVRSGGALRGLIIRRSAEMRRDAICG